MTISAAEKAQYETLAKKITELEAKNVDVTFPQEAAKLKGLKESLAAYQQAMQGAAASVAKEKAEAEAADASKIRRKLLGAKFEKLAEKEKAEYKQAFDKYKTVEEQVQQVTAAANAQAVKVAELEQVVNQLEAARSSMKELVGRGYSGAPGDAEENALEAELKALGPKKDAIIAEARNYGVAGQSLMSASKQLNDAMRQLQIGHQLNGMDMMGNFMGPGGGMNPGGLMGDMMERQSIKAAGQLVAAAGNSIAAAYQAVPGMPPIRHGALDDMKVFGHYIMPGMDGFFDAAKQQRINQGLQQIRTIQMDVQRAMQWLQSQQAQVESRVAAIQQEARMKDNQLMRKRMALLKTDAA